MRRTLRKSKQPPRPPRFRNAEERVLEVLRATIWCLSMGRHVENLWTALVQNVTAAAAVVRVRGHILSNEIFFRCWFNPLNAFADPWTQMRDVTQEKLDCEHLNTGWEGVLSEIFLWSAQSGKVWESCYDFIHDIAHLNPRNPRCEFATQRC